MSIVYKNNNGLYKTMKSTAYLNEAELQELVSHHPYLIMADNEPDVAFIKREYILKDAGKIDLILIDSCGLPIVVEVKLARNAQSRREVIAQAFDYVSALTLLTVDELNESLDGKLEEAINTLSDKFDDSGKTFEYLWQQCGTNLRAGKVRLVVVIDEASEDLIRIVRFINDHSDIDVRLVEILKYENITSIDESILVPNLIVHGGGNQVSYKSNSNTENDMIIESITSEYNKIADSKLLISNKNRSYRQIYVTGWPTSIHYEFLLRNDTIGVNIDLESSEVKVLGDLFKKLEIPLKDKFLDSTNIYYSYGKLKIVYNKNTQPCVIANVMKNLIEYTYDSINNELKKLNLTSI